MPQYFENPFVDKKDEDEEIRNMWELTRKGLKDAQGSFDEVAKSQVRKLGNLADALLEAKQGGQLRDREYTMELQKLTARANEYPWSHHEIPPEQMPGAIFTEDGIVKQRTQDGMVDVVGYSPQYVRENIVQIGDTGKFAVPLSPRKGFAIVDNKPPERDWASESDAIKDAHKEITNRFKVIRDQREKVRKLVRPDQPFTAEELDLMSQEASTAYVSQMLQAQDVAKRIADGGVLDSNQHVIRGTTVNPMAPVPTMTPMPPASDALPERPAETILPTVSAREYYAGDIPAVISPEDWTFPFKRGNYQLPFVREDGSFSNKLLAAASLPYAARAASKEEFETVFQSAPNGLVVEMPDGVRYVKDEGKFWQVPWTKDQLEQRFAVDEAGEVIYDPATTGLEGGPLPAPGIVEQLRRGRGGQMVYPGPASTLTDEQALAGARSGSQVPLEREQAERIAKLINRPVGPEDIAEEKEEQEIQATIEEVQQKRAEAASAQDARRKAQPPPAGAVSRDASSNRMLQDLAKTFKQDWTTDPVATSLVQRRVRVDTSTDPESVPVGTVIEAPNGKLYLKTLQGLEPISIPEKKAKVVNRKRAPVSKALFPGTL